jgi:hypothetical protein
MPTTKVRDGLGAAGPSWAIVSANGAVDAR